MIRANRLYKEFTVSPKTIVRLNASRPVLVVVYSSGPSADGSMTVVAPQDIYDSQYNVGLDWLNLTEGIAMKVALSQYTPVEVSTALDAKFQKNITAAGFGFLVGFSGCIVCCVNVYRQRNIIYVIFMDNIIRYMSM